VVRWRRLWGRTHGRYPPQRLARGPRTTVAYTPAVPLQTIAQSLAYINWTVLLALALGSFGVVVLCRLRTDATRGYLSFMTFTSALLGLLVLVSDFGLPAPDDLAIAAAPSLDVPRRLCLALFALLGTVYGVAIVRGRRAPALGLAALALGIFAAILGGWGWAGGPVAGTGVAVQFLALSAVTGGALAALVLGHWYLVTPRLSEGPLLLTSRALMLAVALQLGLFFVWLSTGAGAGRRPFEPLVGEGALLIWLRLIVGLCFPLVLSFMAVRTAHSRSMESATGILYIDLAAIASGTIVAAGLYFAFGLLL